MSAPDASTNAAPTGPKAQALLLECFEQYCDKLVDIGRASVEMSGDLFDGNAFITEKDVDEFKQKRLAWVDRFDQALTELYQRRMSGTRRKGRRPDFDASLSTLRVLTAFDQEKQAALVAATAFLHRLTRRELDALDLRIEALLPGEKLRDIDNPFAPAYILDAIGLSARAIYPNPRIWRPFMERLVADLTPAANKVYITLNRFLADRGVLPEIKAALRARSEFRPVDDKDLIPTFSKMLHEVGQSLPTDVVVPNLSGDLASASVFDFTGAGEKGAETVAAILPSAVATGDGTAAARGDALAEGFATLERQVPAAAARSAAGGDGDPTFGHIDPLMALGSSTPLFNTLGHWQRIDLPGELAKLLPNTGVPGGAAVVPLNLIPHIRDAVSSQMANPTDRITMDVIGLLFDYIFRDPTIPDELRTLFGRLQVPVLKAALLDRAFFSEPSHPARKLLDHLADAAVGATQDDAYERALEHQAASVVEHVCRNFEIDLKVFVEADTQLARFIEAERRSSSDALEADVNAALEAERNEKERAEVRAIVRDKLAGVDLPFEVRGFIETVWADYLAVVRRDRGPESSEWTASMRTLDDLLWSIVAKERTAQKARLTKMIPTLVMGLRKGCTAVSAPSERTKSFFEALYPLHVAAIKPQPEAAVSQAAPDIAPDATGTARGRPKLTRANVHDFVSEMAVGTWLSFKGDKGTPVNARLAWVSPLRTKYIFTSRSRAEAFMFTPEELAWEIAGGRAELLLEPVPLFDRAVSAALDTLAAQRPKQDSSQAA